MNVKKFLTLFFLSFLAGSLTLACYSIVSSFLLGAKSPNVLAEITSSPVIAIVLHYDILVLGKTKLFSSLVFFNIGFFIAGAIYWARASKKLTLMTRSAA